MRPLTGFILLFYTTSVYRASIVHFYYVRIIYYSILYVHSKNGRLLLGFQNIQNLGIIVELWIHKKEL